MKTRTVLAAIASAIVLPPQLVAASPDFPPGIQNLVKDALQQIGYWDVDWVPSRSERERYENRIAIFDADIEKMAELIDADLAGRLASMEGDNIEAKIATLACQRKLRRDLFDEIETTYCALPKNCESLLVAPRHGGGTGVLAPNLKKEHRDPKFRHAFEYCQLKYENYERKRDRAARPLGIALASLGDERSLIVWEFLYERAVLAQEDRFCRESERYCDAIWNFPSARGVAGLLKFYELSKTGQPEWVDWREFETPADYFIYLYGKSSPEQKEKWKVAIGSYDRSGLSEEQRNLLKGIIEFQPPGPQPRPALLLERRPK
jgi:hypothetical protein